jgi:hypothetical protein
MQTNLTLDRGEKLIVAETIQDVEPILEHNKVLRSIEQKSDWGRHIASVPDVIVVEWLNEEYKRGNTHLRYLGPGFDEWFAKKLRDPDNKAWRTDNPSNPFFMGWR